MIVDVPAFVVLIVPTGVTDFTLLLPLLLIVTAAFRSSFVTGAFWFLTILFPVGAYSSLSLRTATVTFTVSFEPSGYVTVTTPAFSPGPVVVLGVVAHVYVVPAGNPFLLILVPGSGVWAWLTSCILGLATAVYFCVWDWILKVIFLVAVFPFLSTALTVTWILDLPFWKLFGITPLISIFDVLGL